MSASSDPLSTRKLSTPEFVAMTAYLMALNALAIDIMLPALSEMGQALNVVNPNDAQLIIVVYMLGFGTSQLLWGPITDRFGRQPVLRLVLVFYMLAAIGCAMAPTFTSLLIWRVILGIAAGGTRVVAVSVVRDLYVGRGMARIMSLVMTVFMVIPILAPTIGLAIMHAFGTWQSIFGALAIGGAIMLVWSYFRLPETRPADARTPLNPRAVMGAYATVFKTRDALGYMLASGVIFGALFAFISASEQIFNDIFEAGDIFAYCFAGIAAAMSVSNFTNSRLVEKLGQRMISHTAMVGFIVFSVILTLVTTIFGPNLIVFMILFSIVFMNFGFMGPNFSSMAMESLGKIAGTASALLGFASTTMAALIGGLIAHQYNGSLTPILLGYVGLGMLSLIIVFVTERFKLFGRGLDETAE